MTASILDNLDRLADQHPDKPFMRFLDVNGDPIESYTYASFLYRAEAIASHLRKEGRFAARERLLLAYPPGLGDDLRVLWLRSRGIDPSAGLSAQFARFPERPVQDGPHRQGLPGVRDFNEQRLPRIAQDEPGQKRSLGVRRGRRLHFRPSLDRHGRTSWVQAVSWRSWRKLNG